MKDQDTKRPGGSKRTEAVRSVAAWVIHSLLVLSLSALSLRLAGIFFGLFIIPVSIAALAGQAAVKVMLILGGIASTTASNQLPKHAVSDAVTFESLTALILVLSVFSECRTSRGIARRRQSRSGSWSSAP